MLEQCFCHYGLTSSKVGAAVERLALLCFRDYPCGYSFAASHRFCFSLDEGSSFLGVPSLLMAEVLHYGALFGLITDVVLSPSHIEFSLNPYYRRDLFFARLRLELREQIFSV